MEFTPKKDGPIIKTYSKTQGKNNVRRDYKYRGVSSANSTPNRFSKGSFKSRTDKILENSSLRAEKDEPTKLNMWLNKKGSPAKRPLALNNTQSGQKPKDSDPYNVFADSDEDSEEEIFLSAKRTVKTTEKVDAFQKKDSNFYSNKENSNSNKENSIFGSPAQSSKYSFKSYGSAKRKQFSYPRNTQFKGVSPVKVERLYGEQEVGGSLWNNENEKENIPVITETNTSDSLDTVVSQPHLMGFPNYGNTCYLNAVVQSLLALPSFTLDLQHLTSSLSPDRTSLFHSLGQVLNYRDKLQLTEVKTKLKSFKDNVVRVDDSFSGFKMQDANELLTLLLDTIKDEVERCHMTTPSPDHPSTSSTERLILTPEHPGSVQTQCFEPSSETVFPAHDHIETDLFGPNEEASERIDDRDFGKNNNSFDSHKLNDRNSSIENSDLNSNERTSVDSVVYELEKGSEDFNVNKSCFSSPAKKETSSNICNKKKLPKNPVKDNFEFQLLESYRCLSCSEVIGRNQEYFGLYVNLPEKETDDSSFDEDVKLTGEGLSTIQDAIDAYMSADERELNCEKCGHDKAEVVTSVTSLPRILVVQLKRYEYKPEMFESLKVSSRVFINQWISLDKFTSDDVKPIKLCSTDDSSIVPKAPKQATLTVRNLSSELNVIDKKEENSKEQAVSPIKPPEITAPPSAEQEDEELQEVMRRSMDDMGGPGTAQSVPNQEEDEIQQAIRLSLQDVGMSFSVENAEDSRDGFEPPKIQNSFEFDDDITMDDNRHTYRLMSIISHFGLTTKTGHYVSDVYNVKEDSWFHYDDETVTPITESVVTAGGRQKNGYIFFYVHRDFFEQLQK
ncbi:unnamed protein product, partial [Meganyctiphanes norvegica]